MDRIQPGQDNCESEQHTSDRLQQKDFERRRALADQLPFIARVWWLRESSTNSELIAADDPTISAPIWSYYSDPLCDLAGLDYASDIEES